MRVQPAGAISVTTSTEFWLAELQAGRCFAAGGIQGPTAANNSHVQLFNPVASGVTLLVRALYASLSVAGSIQIGFYDTALTTLNGNALNLLRGAAVSVAEARRQDNVGVLPSVLMEMQLGAAQVLQLDSMWLCQLGPGTGFVAVAKTVNVGITAQFVWREV